jgi:hypothetical protein
VASLTLWVSADLLQIFSSAATIEVCNLRIPLAHRTSLPALRHDSGTFEFGKKQLGCGDLFQCAQPIGICDLVRRGSGGLVAAFRIGFRQGSLLRKIAREILGCRGGCLCGLRCAQALCTDAIIWNDKTAKFPSLRKLKTRTKGNPSERQKGCGQP